MKSAAAWIAFIVVVIILYVADIKHLAPSRYNFFLLLLLGLVAALVVIVKICYTPPPDSQKP